MNQGQNDVPNVPKKSDDIPLPFDGSEKKPAPSHDNVEVMDGKDFNNPRAQSTGVMESNQSRQPQGQGGRTNTAVATQQPQEQKQLATPFMKLLNSKKNALQNFLGNEKNALKFMSSVMHSFEKVPELAKCDQASLIGAFMECAAIGLYPGNASGDCYVLPYKNKAQFQLGYKGVKTLAYRSGVLRMWAEIRYKKDKFKQVFGTSPQLIHEPFDDDDENRGEAIGAYACAEVTPGNVIFKYLPKSKIMKIKALSPSAKSDYSPWNKTDPDLWMWKKCAVKQLGKMMPLSDELKRALYLDNVSERGGYIEAEGEVIEMPFQTADEKIDEVKDKKAAMRAKKK